MGRGFLSFVLVLAFAAMLTHCLYLHYQSVDRIRSTEQFIIEQQVVDSKGHDFESAFWQAANATRGDVSHKLWGELETKMEDENATIWTGTVSPNSKKWVEQKFLLFAPEFRKWNNTQGKEVLTLRNKNNDTMFAVGAHIIVGGTESIYLIQKGREYEL